MRRVKCIKEILPVQSALFTVIKKDGKSSQRGVKFHRTGKQTVAGVKNGKNQHTFRPIVFKAVEYDNQHDPKPAVIRM